MVYGNFTSEQVSEKTVCEALGIYGALKFSGEKMVVAYNQVFDYYTLFALLHYMVNDALAEELARFYRKRSIQKTHKNKWRWIR